MKIALFITATGKYTEFLPKLIQSADQYFLQLDGFEVQYHIFTDNEPEVQKIQSTRKIVTIRVPHEVFPKASINRFNFYRNHLRNLLELRMATNFLFCIDADAYFASPISSEILSPFVLVQHSAFVNNAHKAPIEKNKDSYHYMEKVQTVYVGGGFYGGESLLMEVIFIQLQMGLEIDAKNGITPIWHDETALNKYLSHGGNHYTKILPPTYHYCEHEPGKLNPYMHELWMENQEYIKQRWAIEPPFMPKIIFVDKDKAAKGSNYYRN